MAREGVTLAAKQPLKYIRWGTRLARRNCSQLRTGFSHAWGRWWYE